MRIEQVQTALKLFPWGSNVSFTPSRDGLNIHSKEGEWLGLIEFTTNQLVFQEKGLRFLAERS